MKMSSGRNIFRKTCLAFGFALVFSLLGCDNPFKAGLGPIVDIRPPTIKLISPEVDSFIRGTVTFTGFAEDDFKLAAVYIKVVNYPDLPGNPWPVWTPVDVLQPDGNWRATIETLGNDPANPIFPDGFFKIRLKAVDSVGKWAGDEDIVFTVKNMPPVVALTLPSVTEGTKPGEAGSTKINYGWAGDFDNNFGYREGSIFPSYRIIDTGGILTGTIQDKEGISFEKSGVFGDSDEKYPPQYRFWHIDPDPAQRNPIEEIYPPDEYPDPAVLNWKDFVTDKDSTEYAVLMEIGVNQYNFSYKVPGESDSYYGFEVRVQSKDGKKFRYPRDHLPDSWWRSTDTKDIDRKENQYVLFYARLPQEYPTMDLYQLQDIFGEGAWGEWEVGGPAYYRNIPDTEGANVYHPYVNTPTVFKNGAFTLRVKTSHSRSVDEARVFWERSDRTAKGLFVWDPADKHPYPTWDDTRSNISTDRPYEQWGYNDQNQRGTRNFIFTYNGVESLDTIPNTAAYHEFARGRYKILQYIGPETDWKNDKNRSSWREYKTAQGRLEEGTYEITGTTVNGNSEISKALCTITIDEVGPEINFNGIEGSLDDGSTDGSRPYTVNGVVRPLFNIYDARARDSGLRLARDSFPLAVSVVTDADYYKRDPAVGGRVGDEARYMVIDAADKATMDAYLAGHPWPSIPPVATMPYDVRYRTIYEKPDTALIPGVTVYKNGPIHDGSFKFKATKIYGSGTEDVLPDEKDYLIYVFARDNAFNVTSASYPIYVSAKTDIPGLAIIPEGAIANVTDPSHSADYDNSDDGNGFLVNDGSGGKKVRNKFGTSTTLRLRLKDDDSLDLGDQRLVDDGKPGIRVKITATTSDKDGTVTLVVLPPLEDERTYLTDEQILGIFLGQPFNESTLTRSAVRERQQGTIGQLALLQRLKEANTTDPTNPYNQLFGTVPGDNEAKIREKKEAFQTSLPEGIYRITVTVKDYPPLKLKLPFETTNPDPAEVSEEIWIAVDTTGPFIDRDSIKPKEGEFLASEEDITIEGTVRDRNGPVTVAVNGFSSVPVLNPPLKPEDIDVTTNAKINIETGEWETEFIAKVNLKGVPSAIDFTFVFQDRFGNTNQPFRIRYSADTSPPVVNLTRMIRTFERDQDDVTLHDPVGTIGQWPVVSTPSENKVRLTNGVVSFEVTATDNSGIVAGLRWWLLPANKGSAAGLTALNSTGLVTDYNAYPFTSTPLANKGETNYFTAGAGAYGEIDMNQSPYRVYLDTEKLHGMTNTANPRSGDGEYRLHIIAVDKPGNASYIPADSQWPEKHSIWQEIYVLQEQDRPYFEQFSPGGTEDDKVVDTLIITGTIYDDHGFDNNGTLRGDSVRIWFSNTDTPPTQAALDAFLLETTTTDNLTGFTTPVDLRPETDFKRVGKNINVRIDLKDPYYSSKFDTGNGPKSYIIEAKDSNNSTTSTSPSSVKIKDDGNQYVTATPAGEDSRRSRRQYYSFDYDDRDPVIVLEEPRPGSSFGVTANIDFWLQGYIEDAYLRKNSNNNYYIWWRLGSGTDVEFELLPAYITSEGPSANGTRVNFKIPANIVTGTGMLDFYEDTKVPPGQHILTLKVEDQSRKTASAVLTFIKDQEPPDFDFTNIDKQSVSTLPPGIGNWWDRGSINETDWYNAKRAWLVNNPVSTIYYDTGVPELTGIFTDATSDIDLGSVKYFFDNKGGPPQTDWAGTETRIVLEGSGRNVRWTIPLVEADGKTPLPDGIHTIRLSVADVCGNVLNPNPNAPDTYMYAFRIVSSVMPVAKIITKETDPALVPDVTGYGYNVFGNPNGFGSIVFSIIGTAESPNLQDVRLKIVETLDRSNVLVDKYLVKDGYEAVWSYAGGSVPPEKEIINWKYDILTDWYRTLTPGKSYDVIAIAVGRGANPNGIESEEVIWAFTSDMEGPKITFAGDPKTNNENLNPKEIRDADTFDVFRSSSLKVQGGVADGVSRITALEYKIWQWNYLTGAWVLRTPPATNNGWAVMPNFDAATNTSTDINWTIDLSDLTNYPQGLYRIKVQAKDDSFISYPATPDRIAEGDFNPGGMGNPVTSEYLYFFYDRFGPDGFNPTVNSFYSSRPGNGTITFNGILDSLGILVPYTVRDPNRIRSVTVEVTEGPEGVLPRDYAGMTAVPWTPANPNVGPEETEWSLTLSAPYSGQANAVPDGRYRLKFVAEDMAGNTSTIERTFTLDNTPPEGTIILPEKRPAASDILGVASVVVIGGEAGEITGSTVDGRSPSRAESGVKAMWYHLGYINPLPFNPVGDVRAAYTNYFNENRVWESSGVTGITRENDSGANDGAFDDKAKEISTASRAWFKYEATNAAGGPWPHPTGFIINNINIYDWRMELPHIYPGGWDTDPAHGNSSSLSPDPRGGFKQYANQITVKGRVYEFNGAGARMTIPVPEIIAGQAGVVSMPLWIRVEDNAGNVSYSCRDIWFYPDGDIPSTSILNPEQAANLEGGRAGSISADGVAANNTSVYSVIYRIKADNSQNPTAVIPPGSLNNQIVKFPNDSTEVTLGDYPLEYAKLRDLAPTYLSDGWYHANLEVARGEPIAPWNFLFNTGNEITNMIPAYGFASAGSGSRDMIRVYMEVFVFSGSIGPEQISVAGGTKAAPEPYVRTFYLKEGAPQIPKVWVSTVDNRATYYDPMDRVDKPAELLDGRYYEPYRAGLDPRKGQFYIRAELKASNNQVLNQISVRRPNETVAGSGYQTVWEAGALQGVPGVTVTPLARQQDHVIVYALDSKAATGTAAFASVNGGGWATSGGRYGFEIRIRDNSTPPGEISYILEVSIDNFAPVSDPGIYSSKKAAGSAVDFIGRVYDYQGSPSINDGMPRKVDRVYVWFTKTINGQTNYINFNTGATQLATGNSATRNDIFLNRNARITKTPNGDTVTNIDFANPADIGAPGAVTYPVAGGTFNVAGGWVKEISEVTAQPGTGMTWIPTNDWDIQWVFRTDTTKMPDGRITLNYVVVDGAGNASFYTQDDIYIRNKYPEITRVTLYTDNNGIGAVYTTHDTNSVASTEFALRDSNGNLNYDNSKGYLNSGFISKNQFIGFRVETLLGNPELSYRLQYVRRESIALTTANLQRMVNERNTGVNLYTIDELGDYSNNNWATIGVNVSNPPPGTHFVFTPETLTSEMKDSASAKVWRYTAVLSRPVARPGSPGGVNNPVLPNEANAPQEPGHNFNFNNNVAGQHFDPTQDKDTPTTTRIGEFNGSHPDEDEAALNKPEDTAFFLIKVWDSVNDSAGATENDQLYDAVVIGMNVYLNDRERPVSRLYDLNPYTEAAVSGNNIGTTNQQNTRNRAMDPRAIGENILRGGLYNTGTSTEMVKSGHIEPRNNTTALQPEIMTPGMTTPVSLPANGYWPGDTSLLPGAVNRDPDGGTTAKVNNWKDGTPVPQDQVSGKLILRGVAWDNQLIKEIRVRIGTAEAAAAGNIPERAILRLDTSGNAQTNPNFRTLQPVNGAQAVAVEEMHWKTGHTVEWAYIWDTETRPNADGRPEAAVPVLVTVVDQLGTGGGLSSEEVLVSAENATEGKFHNRVNVDIVPYVTGFTRDSRFATKRSRQGWYSFYQGETGIKATGFNLGTGSGTTVRLYTNAANFTILTPTAQNRNNVTFNIPADANSGKISLWVGAQEALNHRTGHTTQSWNREFHQFTNGSDLWLNKSFAHIWRSNHQSSPPVTYFGNNTAAAGSMSLQRPGMALEYTGGNAGRLTGAWAIYDTAGVYWGFNTNAARTNLYHLNGEPYAGTDISYYNGATANGAIVLTLENDGVPNLILRHGTNFGTTATASDTDSPRPTKRWMHSRVSSSANQSHISSYDAFNNRLYYSRGANGSNAATTRMTIDGDGSNVTGGSIATSVNAGGYSAIDYDSTGPVIAYYDQEHDTIRLAHASTEAPAAGNWTRRYVLPETHSLFRGSGTYVSIKVDKGNGIHLAFYNSVYQTVVYAYAPSRTGTFTAYTVDNVIKGGAWTDISVDDNGNPTIVYADSARTGNYDGIRMAYKSSGDVTYTGSLRCPVTGENITGWEAMTAPANYQINDDRLNVEVWPPNNRAGGTVSATNPAGWSAAVGYASRKVAGLDEGMFRLAYFYQPLWEDYTQ